jgi:hypothetical protein
LIVIAIDWTGVDLAQRNYYAQQPNDSYRTWVQTRHGKERRIHEPVPLLKSIQLKLLAQLVTHLRHHEADHCANGKSTVSHARLHAGPLVLLTMDVANFFDAVPMRAVEDALAFIAPDDRWLVRVLCTYHGKLVTGAPTSPALASAAFYPIDLLLQTLAETHWAVYSRYVDDLAFSWHRPAEIDPKHFARKVEGALRVLDFRTNRDKTTIAGDGQRQEIVGLIVNREGDAPAVRAPREHWRRLRAMLHLYKTKRGRARGSLRELQGLAGYLQMVEPERATPYLEAIERLRHG